MISTVLSLLLLAIAQVNGAGDFVFYKDSSCQNGYTYLPAVFVMGYPEYWNGNCLNIGGTNEHFEVIYQQTSSSASFHLQIWDPTLYCGWMFSNTETDSFDVSSDTPDITCRQGVYTSQNTTYVFSVPVWITVVPDYGSSSSSALPGISSSSSTGLAPSSSRPRSSSSSASLSSSYAPTSSVSPTGSVASSSGNIPDTSEPFPFDSSILNPTGPIEPDTNIPFPTSQPSSSASPSPDPDGDPDKSSNAMVIGIVSGVVFVVVVLAALGIYFFVKRRRQSQDGISLQDRPTLRDSLYVRDARYSDDY